MRDRRWRRLTASAVLVASLCAIVGTLAWRQARDLAGGEVFPAGTYAYLEGEPDRLFRTVAPSGPARPGRTAGVGDREPIRISLDAALRAADAGAVPVVLPDGTRYDVRFERSERAATGDWTFVGRVSTPLGMLASVLTFGPDGVFGTLPAPDGRMFHITTSHGASTIAIAGGVLPPGVLAADPRATDIAVHGPRDGDATQSVSVASASAPASVASGEVTIDVLGLYTTELVAHRGSDGAVETEFANLVAVANQAHIDSGTIARFRLVGFGKTDYPAESSDADALDAITGNALPDGFDVASARRTARADLVAMLRSHVDIDGTCGIAWLNGYDLDPRPDPAYGFSVSNIDPCGPLVLAHELGHNLGSMHDIEADYSLPIGNALAYGAYPFSFGYREGGPAGLATVMAYTLGEPWLGRFSDPMAQDCGGRSCGSPEADNRRSINLMADRIAGLVDPPGTISIHDTQTLERGDEHTNYSLSFDVRLSDPAPAGGVSFEVAFSDATATAGLDYDTAQRAFAIPEGETLQRVFVLLRQDEAVEEDETFRATLRNVVGATIHDGEAIATIVDDDPRATVRGRILFPEGVEPPGIPFWIYLRGSAAQRHEQIAASVQPPSFAYEIPVLRGAVVTMRVDPPAPFPERYIELGVVSGDMRRDIELPLPARISGRIVFPEGAPVPADGIGVLVTQQHAPGSEMAYAYGYAEPPEFRYEVHAQPGMGRTMLSVDPPSAPYAPYAAPLPDVDADVVFDIHLDEVPTLYMFAQALPEGSDANTNSVWPAVWLSAPAPAGGVTADIATVAGTATPGTDFVPRTRSIVIEEGGRLWQDDAVVEFIADSEPEASEVFSFVIDNAVGARVATPRVDIRILNDDLVRGVASDADADGRSDLLWRSLWTSEVEGWFMNGPRALGGYKRWIDPDMRILASGDFDGDGSSDLFLHDDRSELLSLWRAMAGGGYDDATFGSHPGGDWRLAGAGDVNGDGRDDILWHSGSLQRLDWWLVDGLSPIQTGSADVPESLQLVAVADLDGDLDDDLVWRDGERGELVLWPARATGGFAAPETIAGLPGGDWTLVDAIDVDGDGRAELVWHSAASERLAWWSMQGATRVAEGGQTIAASLRIAAVGDYNGDGRTDLVWRDMSRSGLWMSLARPGGFTLEWMSLHPGQQKWPVQPQLSDAATGLGGNGGDLYAGDADGDGDTDLLWHSRTARQLDWWWMRGHVRQWVGGQAMDRDFEALAWDDFDGDGMVDVVWRDQAGGGLWLWRSRAAGQYEPEYVGPHPGSDWAVVGSDDIDGDGRADLFWRSLEKGRFDWWLMEGARRVGARSRFVNETDRWIGSGDIDNDGLADVVFHDTAGGGLSLWRGKATGDFTASAAFGTHPGRGWTLVDVLEADGDAHPDLAWHNPWAERVEVWLMQDAGRVATTTHPIAGRYRLAASGDFDGDGRGDIAWRDGARRELWLWRAAGAGPGFEMEWIADYPREATRHPGAFTGLPPGR